MSNLVDRFIQIDATLALAGVEELSPSEVHGTIVGAICNHMKSGQTPDLMTLIEPEADPNEGRFNQLSEALYDLYRENTEMLLESKEGFGLILPDEDERIDVRVDARALLAAHYDRQGLPFNVARQRMARIPDGARLIENPVSIAPGVSMENVHVMAGVPSVFQDMVARILPALTGGAQAI